MRCGGGRGRPARTLRAYPNILEIGAFRAAGRAKKTPGVFSPKGPRCSAEKTPGVFFAARRDIRIGSKPQAVPPAAKHNERPPYTVAPGAPGAMADKSARG